MPGWHSALGNLGRTERGSVTRDSEIAAWMMQLVCWRKLPPSIRGHGYTISRRNGASCGHDEEAAALQTAANDQSRDSEQLQRRRLGARGGGGKAMGWTGCEAERGRRRDGACKIVRATDTRGSRSRVWSMTPQQQRTPNRSQTLACDSVLGPAHRAGESEGIHASWRQRPAAPTVLRWSRPTKRRVARIELHQRQSHATGTSGEDRFTTRQLVLPAT